MALNPLELLAQLPGAAAQGLIWGVMAIGVLITYKILNIADLSVDGSFCTGGAVCVMLLLAGHNVATALAAAFAAGLLAGLVTGFFHTACGISAILAGILTQIGLWSVNLAIMGRANQAINVSRYKLLVSLRYLQEAAKGALPFYRSPIFVMAVLIGVVIGCLYWFFGTETGACLRATGANPNMARAQGINTEFNKILGLMLSNGIVALSGGLLAQYQGFADINMGRGAIVIGLAAVIIGEVAFSKIFHNFAAMLLGAVLGAIIYYAVIQTVLWMRLDANYLKLFSAMMVAAFLTLPYWKEKYFGARAGRKGVKRDA
jgi:putative ABC transport system permease protein